MTKDSYMYDICAITTIHRDLDNRIYYRQLKVLSSAGLTCSVIAPWSEGVTDQDGIDLIPTLMPRSRLSRAAHTVSTLLKAIKVKTSVYIFHDPDFLLAAVVLKLITRKTVIYDCHENIPEDIRYGGKPWIPSWFRVPLSKTFQGVEQLCARNLNAVMCVVPHQQNRFNKCGVNTFLFRNFCSLDPDLSFMRDYTKLLYTGTISKNYGAEFLIDLGRAIKLSEKPYSITISDYFGLDTSYRSEFLSLIKDEDLPFVVKQPVFADELNALAGDCGIGLVICEPTFNKLLTYPTKLFEYMRLGIYPVSVNVGYAKEILENGRLGELCQYNDTDAWLLAFDRILHNSEARDKTLEKIKDVDDSLYSWLNEKEKFIAFIKPYVRRTK